VTDVLRLAAATRPLDAVVTVPGSKSIANRALVCAALADGDSRLHGLPSGDDTVSMIDCLRRLGLGVAAVGDDAVITGSRGAIDVGGGVTLDAGLAGTTSRFVTALAALARRPVTIDGAAPLRRRPMGPLHRALVDLGAEVVAGEGEGRLPVTVRGPLHGGEVALPGDVSSQFLTALMLVAPLLDGGLRVRLTTPLVSVPYIRMTAAVMAAFGVEAVTVEEGSITVGPSRYRGTDIAIEPDASSASYPLAMAAVVGGRVQIRGLHRTSSQGDVVFAELLGRMGCGVGDDGGGLAVSRDPAMPLVGLDVDMADISDLVPTVAAVAVLASTPTTIRGVGFIRAKESDRLGDLAGELAALGAAVTVTADGLRIEPAGPLHPLHGAELGSHDDHRLAMAFGVVGAAVAGVVVRGPEVVAKSWPGYWAVRDAVVSS
jgi:3-phosphoshikimate 1-carboxyvinyltransferase